MVFKRKVLQNVTLFRKRDGQLDEHCFLAEALKKGNTLVF